jgi:hypothetical protein
MVVIFEVVGFEGVGTVRVALWMETVLELSVQRVGVIVVKAGVLILVRAQVCVLMTGIFGERFVIKRFVMDRRFMDRCFVDRFFMERFVMDRCFMDRCFVGRCFIGRCFVDRLRA